jgi:ATP-dependent Clp protease ATP-binding subunit ClpB
MSVMVGIMPYSAAGEKNVTAGIELRIVQQRIFNATLERSFLFELTAAAKALLLREGTDVKYGARHLKRAIERLLVQPICSLIATQQVRGGDCIRAHPRQAAD